ncbi:hypothetical protein B0T16DRAFT_406980 [Cercophora newfieldiana]|uniref:Uncharacterized protein n=1 Tax=Cercophora newfieldiana TaxID=92897 RepID=A0AA39YHS9_9PEZI|nr:hypothetical protein B0T16DRAFT_406980 [Cercophora newfieldiana]
MDLDIEMDVDIDVQLAPQIPEAYTEDITLGEEQEPGEVDEPLDGDGDYSQADKAIVPNKVHIRGLDTFTPDDVKSYLTQHGASGQFERIEWIDDSSANLLFRSESAAHEALIALAALAIADATQLPPLENVPAKQSAAKPDSVLLVRFAVTGDKKAVGAAHRSRFYLLHPEYDPEERRRSGNYGRGKYRDRDGGYRRDHRGGRDGRRRDRRDEDDDPEPFDVNLYDDDPAALAQRTLGRRTRSRSRRRHSVSSGSPASDRDRSYSRRNQEKELFPDRRSGNGYRARESRARSASPVRDRDGDANMDDDQEARNAAALRSRERGRSIKERLSRDNSARDSAPRELFPRKDKSTKELFPTKIASGTVGKAQMDQVDDNTILTSAKLADRITTRPTAAAGGLNIRGLATRRGDQGLAIKGTGTTVKELFPDKFNSGNAGKELFAEKLEGRGRRRQKAEDMFY